MCFPSIIYYPTKGHSIEISLLHSLLYQYHCKNCNKALITRDRFFVHGWDHKQNIDLLHQLSSLIEKIKGNSPDSPTQDTQNVQYENSKGENTPEMNQINQINLIKKDDKHADAFSLYEHNP